MKTPVILVSNFLSASGGSRGVCEELAVRLAEGGTPTLTTSSKKAKLPRLLDMIRAVVSERHHYDVAQVDVYSGLAFFWAEAVTATLRWLGKPYVLTLHGGNLPSFARQHPARVRRLLNNANVVTTPSRYLREGLSTFRPDLRLIPNALYVGRYPFRLRTNPNPSLVWLRAFHEIYNPTLAPKVLHRLAKRFPDIHLTMIGPDKEDGSFQRTQEMATQLKVQDRLCLPGGIQKAEVPARLSGADIFINTTNVDNTPVSILEAMACGLCIVSTNVGGLPYLLKDGEDALLVPPNDDAAMANAIARVLTEPGLSARLSQSARAKVEAADWSIVLPQWEELFRSVVDGGENSLAESKTCVA